jgi:hypothetical protein
MAKGEQKNVNIKTDGLTRDEILTRIRMHNSASQKALAMCWAQHGEEGLDELRAGLSDVETAIQEQLS